MIQRTRIKFVIMGSKIDRSLLNGAAFKENSILEYPRKENFKANMT
jgi:hypothetical protein